MDESLEQRLNGIFEWPIRWGLIDGQLPYYFFLKDRCAEVSDALSRFINGGTYVGGENDVELFSSLVDEYVSSLFKFSDNVRSDLKEWLTKRLHGPDEYPPVHDNHSWALRRFLVNLEEKKKNGVFNALFSLLDNCPESTIFSGKDRPYAYSGVAMTYSEFDFGQELRDVFELIFCKPGRKRKKPDRVAAHPYCDLFRDGSSKFKEFSEMLTHNFKVNLRAFVDKHRACLDLDDLKFYFGDNFEKVYSECEIIARKGPPLSLLDMVYKAANKSRVKSEIKEWSEDDIQGQALKEMRYKAGHRLAEELSILEDNKYDSEEASAISDSFSFRKSIYEKIFNDGITALRILCGLADFVSVKNEYNFRNDETYKDLFKAWGRQIHKFAHHYFVKNNRYDRPFTPEGDPFFERHPNDAPFREYSGLFVSTESVFFPFNLLDYDRNLCCVLGPNDHRKQAVLYEIDPFAGVLRLIPANEAKSTFGIAAHRYALGYAPVFQVFNEQGELCWLVDSVDAGLEAYFSGDAWKDIFFKGILDAARDCPVDKRPSKVYFNQYVSNYSNKLFNSYIKNMGVERGKDIKKDPFVLVKRGGNEALVAAGIDEPCHYIEAFAYRGYGKRKGEMWIKADKDGVVKGNAWVLEVDPNV